MNAELFVHGPRHAFYGKQDEASYSTLFDDSSVKDEVRFIVELRKGADNKWYTYYNYCRYGNVTDIDGRSGAYLGITLRLDAYYANLRAVYTILDAVFSKGAVGLLVKKVPTGYQYLVNNFESSKALILEKIEKPLGTLLSNVMAVSEVLPIDETFKPGGKAYVRGIDDTQSLERRLAEMRATGKIVFASSAPVEQMQVVIDQCNRDKQSFAESKQQEISRLESNLSNASKEASATLAKLAASESEACRLSAEISGLKKEIESFEIEKKEIGSLKDEKKSLANQLRFLESKNLDLQRQLERLQSELKMSESLKGEISRANNRASKEITTLNQEITSLKRDLESLKKEKRKESIKDVIKDELGDIKGAIKGKNVLEEEHEDGVCFRLSKYLIPIASFLVGAAIFGTLCYFMGAGQITSEPQDDQTSPSQNGEVSVGRNELPYVRDTLLFPSANGVECYLKINQEEICTGKTVDILIAQDKVIPNAIWEVSGKCSRVRKLRNAVQFIPSTPGEYKVSYVRNDTIVIQRIINVEK